MAALCLGCTSAAPAPDTTPEAPSATEASAEPGGDSATATSGDDLILAAVNAPRDPRDTGRDEIRKPVELLRFFDVAEGMRVADLGSGPGYTASLVAAVVGPTGKVFAQNPAEWSQFSWPAWEERKANGRLPQVETVERPFDDPLPPEASNLDLVLSVLIYHDVAYMPFDRDQMNKKVFAALVPGGIYGVVDHYAVDGAGVSVAESLHRIEKAIVIAEVEAAGFELVDEADFLRDHDDDRTSKAWNNPQPVTDRFVLKFRKPE
ncbi:class I SAM-dependent methyltransferase [Haliangium sp.]|uniref:class I SAM-dependent methyltransferase n=1 Tax=Haliangium sp. TaxID=2663208 RepID=UPI003D096B89